MKCLLGLKSSLDKLGPFFIITPITEVVRDVDIFLFEMIQFRKQKESGTACLFGTEPAGILIYAGFLPDAELHP